MFAGVGSVIHMRSESAAKLVQARHRGQNVTFTGIQNDTRKMLGEEIYIAIRGDHVDGHDFIKQAYENGAGVALVEREMDCPISQIICDDSIKAMGLLAANWRAQFSPVLIAITGSNGKTTVKEMLASILSAGGPVLMTQGNLNNHIGVPLTLAGLSAQHQVAIVEMGANHQGEIAYLCQLAKPDVCLINNAAAAHLEGFGSLQGVAECKGEIFLGLHESGTAVVNADDAFYPYWQGLLTDKKQISFALENAATIKGEYHPQQTMSLSFTIDQQRLDIELPLPGRHNAMNALAAVAAALAAGSQTDAIKQGLEKVRPVQGRLQKLKGVNQAQLINDSYNANPASLQAALEWLAAQQGEKILVLGDMFELGADASAHHRQAGEKAKQMGINALLAIGDLGKEAVTGFGLDGHYFPDYAGLIAYLKSIMDASKIILIKGSRGMHMETVVNAVSEME